MNVASNNNDVALRNLVNAVGFTRKLPENVFSDDWKHFLFFDSDRVFASSFASIVSGVLSAEGGVVACLTNIDRGMQEETLLSSSRFMRADISGNDYMSLLNAGGIAAWACAILRFAITSDAGSWSVYGEQNNEIAVIAFQDREFMEKVRPIVSQLDALPIDEAIALPLSYGFEVLPKNWRDRLVESYGVRKV